MTRHWWLDEDGEKLSDRAVYAVCALGVVVIIGTILIGGSNF